MIISFTSDDKKFLRAAGIAAEPMPQDMSDFLSENDLYFLKSFGIATGIAVGRPPIKALEMFKIPLAPSRLRKYKRKVCGISDNSVWHRLVVLSCGHEKSIPRSQKIPNLTFCAECYAELRAETCAEKDHE